MNLRQLGVYFSAMLAMIFWALSFIWYKEVLVQYPPISLVLMRLIISVVLLYAFTVATGKLNRLHLKDLKYFVALAFFQPFLYFLCESYGVSLVSSTLASVIISTIPLLSPVGAYLVLKERITPMNFLGLAISFIGVSLVIFHRGFHLNNVNPVGILCLFVAVFAAVVYALIIKKLSSEYNVFSIVTYQNTLGIIYFLPLFLFFDFKEFAGIVPSRGVILSLLKLGVFASTFAFVLFTHAIKNLGVTRANIFTNTIPVFTAIFAYYLLNEAITPMKIVGIAIVVAGLSLSQVRKGSPAPKGR
ncbi:MAG: DMT family transporter [Tenuifilaceae bacterium]|jgi:drug/metabolite transporter (DMT)-like permease|nr:DMT family transporter [Bacteroidales bacterium]MDI9516120.1 DMT family transporter [Bacteroidota bacterium]NLH57166.1 DMT family transporter [Rikenellaceae bacterium]OQC63782.1 MAG: O-acetylserine/cysteine export protein [Bacteroidetes bacterium ADurb.Bin008]HNV82510.1 DMT family transporter [Tenuifilaceae bacterium]